MGGNTFLAQLKDQRAWHLTIFIYVFSIDIKA